MGFRINTDTRGAFSAHQIQKSRQDLAGSLERLSRGQRINKASDDASGMTIANRLKSQADALFQAGRNAQDAVSIAQVADGALEQAVGLVQDIRTRAIQATGPGQTLESRQAIQSEIDKSLEALNRIADTTSFNGQKLLSGSFTNKEFQIGAGSGETIDMSLGSVRPSDIAGRDTGTLAGVDVTHEQGAQDAIAMADEALAYLSGQRAEVGADQNRLESTINNLSSTRINLLESESGIRDLDYAEESMNLNRIKLLARARRFAQVQAGNVNKQIIDILE